MADCPGDMPTFDEKDKHWTKYIDEGRYYKHVLHTQAVVCTLL